MSPARRWARLAYLISDVVPADVTTRSYPGGVTYLISRRLGDGWIVEIHDSWWSKNDSVWCGYRVWIENDDSICVREWAGLKTTTEVITAVREAVELFRARPRKRIVL